MLPYSYDKDVKALINTADYLHKYGEKVPVDILARLLEAGIDISIYE